MKYIVLCAVLLAGVPPLLMNEVQKRASERKAAEQAKAERASHEADYRVCVLRFMQQFARDQEAKKEALVSSLAGKPIGLLPYIMPVIQTASAMHASEVQEAIETAKVMCGMQQQSTVSTSTPTAN